MANFPSAILIAGPTASGKSALAVSIAREFGGVVVNADSMQVYSDLNIITARPTREERQGVPHELFGHVDAAVNYSVGLWLADFAAAMAKLRATSRVAVVTGGTGMYFKAALYGLSDIPAVPAEVRESVRMRAEGRAPEALHAELMRKDARAAERLKPTDPQRILRALEVVEATGRSILDFHQARSAPILDLESCPAFFVAPPRATLYARIDRRFDKMIEAGALAEVAALGARKLDPALPAMRAHGVPHLLEHLAGRLSLEEAIARGKIDTRHYAKRQFTFARHQLPSFRWVEGEDFAAQILEKLRAQCPP